MSIDVDRCVDCGRAPRPPRSNWDQVRAAIERGQVDAADAEPFHHRCHACHAKREREAAALAESMYAGHIADVLAKGRAHQVRRGRVAHVCDVCGAAIPAGASSWRIAYDRTTYKACAGCYDRAA